MKSKKIYGLIGFPLSHSFSKKFFTDKFDQEHIEDCFYELFPLEKVSDLTALLNKNPDLCGLNVTIPYKMDVIHHLDWISNEAKAIGAVNCIRISAESPVMAAFIGEVGVQGHNFKLEGYNTDAYGFEQSLKPLLHWHHQKALVLGNGGAAQAVKYVLGESGIPYTLVTRKATPDSVLFSDITREMMEQHTIIINTTPLGTYPNTNECPPIPYEFISDEHLLYDLIYNPEQTLFLTKGLEKGAIIKNGHEMLILQAERSWEIWTSVTKYP